MTTKPDDVLGPDARAIVDAARLHEDPSGPDVERLRGRVFAHLGIGVGATAAAALGAATSAEAAVAAGSTSVGKAVVSSATAASIAGAGSTSGSASVGTTSASVGLLGKLGLFGASATAAKAVAVVIAVSTGAAGIGYIASPGERAPAATSSAVALGAGGPVDAAGPERTRPGELPGAHSSPGETTDDGAAEPAAVEPETAKRSLGEAPRKASPAGATGPLPSTRPSAAPNAGEADPLTEETALLARAQSALAAGRHHDALAALDEHQRRYPHGALAHERNGARLLALCGSGRAAEARAHAASFLDAQPASPLAARLRSACGL